jgi:three-Cys-motif partner protein
MAAADGRVKTTAKLRSLNSRWRFPKMCYHGRVQKGRPVAKTAIDPSDGLVTDVVGPWALDKHERLRRYIDAYRSARAMFLPPQGAGGAAYIDLFSGPGRSQRDDTNQFIDGSPIVAYDAARQSGTRFSDLHFNDIDPANVDALEKRIAKLGGTANFYNNGADIAVDRVLYALNPTGLHFAFLDPYNLENLPFSIIKKLATLPRMDMLIHVSVFDLQRNLRRYLQDGRVLDAFMPGWRTSIDANRSDHAIRTGLLHHWLGLIRALGTTPADGIELVSATRGQRLYWLVFVSAHQLGRKLWNDIRNVNVQDRLL